MASTVLRFPLSRADAGLRLDEYLQDRLAAHLEAIGQAAAGLSRAKVRRLVMVGAVRINGRPVRLATQSLEPRGEVTVSFDPARFLAEKKPDDIAFELDAPRVLYEDEWLIAVDKPAGLPSEGTMVAGRDHLMAAVLRYLAARDGLAAPYLGSHQRLDRETSGVLVYAKRREANPGLHQAFLRHDLEKTYLALCAPLPGRPPTPRRPPGSDGLGREDSLACPFRIENRLGRVSPKSAAAKWGAVREGGDPAQTDCLILLASALGTLVEARPLTGRTHQIRVHLAGHGLPLIGDSLYGGPDRLAGQTIGRVMLHAARLRLPHPLRPETLEIEAPLPEDFRRALSLIDKTPGLIYKDQHSRWL